MKRFTRAGTALLLFFILVSAPLARAQQAPLAGFDDYVNKALRDWEVPGLAIAIVKDDAIFLAKGFGVKKIGDPAPVTERTLFAIGSASKAFTAAAVGMLVDEGKVKWDDPATNHLAGFELFDPYVTRELTVRDLLSHRSGLERGDLLWYASGYGRDEVLRRVRYLRPSWGFRGRFGYQNIMYLAAGQILPKVANKSWDEFVRERIFAPLGMAASNTSISALKAAADVASPHAKVDEKVTEIPWRNIDNIGPAGSINSNVTDMAQWVRLQLGLGKYKDRQLLSTGSVKEMQMPQTVIRLEGPMEKLNPDTHFMSYGLGWFLQDYRGRKVVQHGGNIDGMSALVAMMPEEKLGMVILTNMNGSPLPTALMYKVFDSFLGVTGRDWSAELLKVVKVQMEQAKAVEKKMESDRVQGTSPSLPLAKYAGTYSSDMYGDAKVTEQNGRLSISYGGAMSGEMEHWHFNTFRATMKDRSLGKPFVNFTLNASGKVDEMKLVTGPAGEIAFKPAPEKTDETAALTLSEDEMKKLTGKFEMQTPPIEISVELIGGKLKATVPGQPIYTLVPLSPVRFKIAGVPDGFFIEYQVAEGRVKSLTIEQPPGLKMTFMPKP
jgi:CubicO group peptidase (beta-lactamase class C family)